MNPAALAELAVGAFVLAVGGIAVIRVLTTAAVRRELRERALLAAALIVAGLAGLASVAWVSIQAPLARRLLLGTAALAVVFSIVRARPRYGAGRRLPPGSLGLRESLRAIDDPDYYRRSAERHGPVFKMSQIHQRVACITDLERGFRLFREQGQRLRQSDWAFNRLVPGGYLEYTDGERHARIRQLLTPPFTEKVARAARPMIATTAREQLGAMSRDSRAGAVHPEAYLLPIAHAGLIRSVLGIDAGHPEYEALRARFTDLNRSLDLFLPIPRASRDAYEWLAAAVTRLGTSVVERDEGIAVESVLHQLETSHPAAIDDPSVVGNLVLMVKEGGIMTRGLLRWVIKTLADHPGEVGRVREAASDTETLEERSTAFVLETIRHFESPYLYRRVAEEVEIAGYRIPKGWLVRLCLSEAHAPPDAFSDPGAFDPSRFAESVGAERFCPFGAGDRVCPGRHIALEIAKTMVREAALGYDIETVEDGPAWRINRHWGLWRPSLRLHVRLEPRDRSGRTRP